MGYLIDNNAISNYCKFSMPDKACVFMSAIIDAEPFISIITKIEALSWKTTNPVYEWNAQYFVSISKAIDLTPSIVDKTIELRRAMRIKTPDAIIAATALVHNLTLVTSDGDFNGIPGLKIIDPFAI